jgi:hypothetical protein
MADVTKWLLQKMKCPSVRHATAGRSFDDAESNKEENLSHDDNVKSSLDLRN